MRIHTFLLPALLAFSSASALANDKPAPAKQVPAVAAAPASANVAGRVNVNTADAATLASRLNGVGDKKALAIIQHRKQHGPFSSLAQLQQVDGIGPAIVEKNKHVIVFR